MITRTTPAIDRLMPAFDLRTHHHVLVRADPWSVYTAVRRTDLARAPLIRVLFALRGLPAAGADPAGLTLEALVRAGLFVLLAERPGREVVLGVVGRFWRPRGGLAPVDRDEFADFSAPGYARAAWGFRITPAGQRRCLLTTETRVAATSVRARRAFRCYWLLVGPFSGLVRRRALRLIKAEAEALHRPA